MQKTHSRTRLLARPGAYSADPSPCRRTRANAADVPTTLMRVVAVRVMVSVLHTMLVMVLHRLCDASLTA